MKHLFNRQQQTDTRFVFQNRQLESGETLSMSPEGTAKEVVRVFDKLKADGADQLNTAELSATINKTENPDGTLTYTVSTVDGSQTSKKTFNVDLSGGRRPDVKNYVTVGSEALLADNNENSTQEVMMRLNATSLNEYNTIRDKQAAIRVEGLSAQKEQAVDAGKQAYEAFKEADQAYASADNAVKEFIGAKGDTNSEDFQKLLRQRKTLEERRSAAETKLDGAKTRLEDIKAVLDNPLKVETEESKREKVLLQIAKAKAEKEAKEKQEAEKSQREKDVATADKLIDEI